MNKKCITKCYPAKYNSVNPITLEINTNKDYPYCITSDGTSIKCSSSTQDFPYMPQIAINYEEMLKLSYGIHNLTETINWINVHKGFSETSERILDMAWKAYGSLIVINKNELETNGLTDILISYYVNRIKDASYDKIRDGLTKYITKQLPMNVRAIDKYLLKFIKDK